MQCIKDCADGKKPTTEQVATKEWISRPSSKSEASYKHWNQPTCLSTNILTIAGHAKVFMMKILAPLT
jgi:hypothetical protein